jgi:hypothetical protein
MTAALRAPLCSDDDGTSDVVRGAARSTRASCRKRISRTELGSSIGETQFFNAKNHPRLTNCLLSKIEIEPSVEASA